MAKMNWHKIVEYNKIAKNSESLYVGKYAGSNKKFITPEIQAKRRQNIPGMVPCQVLWCTTFIRSGKYCSYHG